MSNLVIVALPEEDDYINKVSSEKVPHLTLCFLGDDSSKVKNINEIIDFTKFAADRTLTRFSLEVDHRGELGPDKADVLFFEKSKWSGFSDIYRFRSNLLRNNNIRTAYDSTEQYAEWTPHITLGYPDTPAKPDDRDYPGIKYVSFDRIAVWFNDFDGVEFPLKSYDLDMEVAMSDIGTKKIVEDILEHHGILGMKWGHRGASATSQVKSNFKKKNPTAEQRTVAITRARANVKAGKAYVNSTGNSAKKAELKKIYLNNPDRATALRLTRGQKITAAVLVATVAPAIPVAAIIGTRVAVRKHIERKQARGGYK